MTRKRQGIINRSLFVAVLIVLLIPVLIGVIGTKRANEEYTEYMTWLSDRYVIGFAPGPNIGIRVGDADNALWPEEPEGPYIYCGVLPQKDAWETMTDWQKEMTMDRAGIVDNGIAAEQAVRFKASIDKRVELCQYLIWVPIGLFVTAIFVLAVFETKESKE